jgi:hypothetical protein
MKEKITQRSQRFAEKRGHLKWRTYKNKRARFIVPLHGSFNNQAEEFFLAGAEKVLRRPGQVEVRPGVVDTGFV